MFVICLSILSYNLFLIDTLTSSARPDKTDSLYLKGSSSSIGKLSDISISDIEYFLLFSIVSQTIVLITNLERL